MILCSVESMRALCIDYYVFVVSICSDCCYSVHEYMSFRSSQMTCIVLTVYVGLCYLLTAFSISSEPILSHIIPTHELCFPVLCLCWHVAFLFSSLLVHTTVVMYQFSLSLCAGIVIPRVISISICSYSHEMSWKQGETEWPRQRENSEWEGMCEIHPQTRYRGREKDSETTH